MLNHIGFPDFSFEDKTVTGNPKARCTVMVGNHIKYERLNKYKNPLNSSIEIWVKDGSNKWLAILGIYRQWKLKGDNLANETEGICKH